MPGYELIGDEERQAVNEIFDDGGILFRHGWDDVRKGRYRVLEFQRAFSQKLGVRHSLATTSGTSAIKVALYAMGIRPGDEVITQSHTFVATIEAIIDAGAVPVLTNVDKTLNMDPEDLERKLTDKTRLIVPVHMLGVPADLENISAFADANDIPVLEDSAQALGGKLKNRPLGTFGKVGIVSLDFGKTITTGEGGMILTNDDEINKIATEYHDHGHENNPELPRGRDTRTIFGFNYRMTELQAAVGIAQLKKLDHIVQYNRQHYNQIAEVLIGLNKFEFRNVPDLSDPLHDSVVFFLPTRELAQELARRMKIKGFGTKNLPDAMEWHFAGYWDHIFCHYGMSREALWNDLRPSYELLSRAIAIPVLVNYSHEDIDRLLQTITKIANDIL